MWECAVHIENEYIPDFYYYNGLKVKKATSHTAGTKINFMEETAKKSQMDKFTESSLIKNIRKVVHL